jgi:hypothetical protein
MFAFTDVVHLLAHEFACLRAGRFSFFFVALRSSEDLFFWHVAPFVENSRFVVLL